MTARSPSNCSTKNRLRTVRFYRSKQRLAEDVLDFVEDRGAALGGLIFDFERRAKLFHELALVARELRRCQHADVIVQVATATAVRVRQAFALDAKDRAALRAFGNLELFLAIQTGHLELRPKCGLRNANGYRAVQIRATPLEERMLLDVEYHVEEHPFFERRGADLRSEEHTSELQ